MKKILLIDDSIFTLNHYSDLLVKMGCYEVFTAENGELGIQEFQKIKPDLVLCDLMMPDMNGLEVLESVQKFGYSSVFLLFTADVQEDTKKKALSLGASGLLEKPLSEEQLQEVLAKYGI